MKFFKKEPEKTVLFVCIENAGRSQMAEGFFNKHAPQGYKAISGGTNLFHISILLLWKQ